ncbi:hypothetical protein [Staphylococcus americanisciuri]|uniref:Uncharacterized protein n=1 Tax=Staphylococcus americanisciuri TaxID=2973940 RepID=A0ABT2F3M0_9STAP|nr:hypothetical protein [Staphylococcus americanisciuri]MCS4486982.1 hypothetical protein [Staphylococcus americanisciuri]
MVSDVHTWKQLIDDLLCDTQPQNYEQDASDDITETYMRVVCKIILI